MEIDRLRYMVASYLRTRLRKVCLLIWRIGYRTSKVSSISLNAMLLQIERFAQYILNDPLLVQRLSQKEAQFAKQCVGFICLCLPSLTSSHCCALCAGSWCFSRTT